MTPGNSGTRSASPADIRRSESQTLITGVYRAGTEYVTQLMSGHPALSATMYRVNVLRFCWGRFDPIQEPTNWRAAVDEIADRLKTRYGVVLRSGEVQQVLDRLTTVDYGSLYDVVMSTLYLGGPVRHWAEKCQLLWREIPKFLEIMPKGRAILVIRDPRSVLASFKRYTYAPPPAYLGAIFNCFDAMKHGLRMAAELPKDRFLMVRYEDAARNPQKTVRRIYEFLGLDEPPTPQNPSSWRDAYGKPWIANSSFDKADQDSPFDIEASIHRWREGLAPAEVGLTEAVCSSYLEPFDYEPSGIDVPWVEMLRLLMADDAMTAHFRRWLMFQEGMEAFPTDPLDPTSWRED